jgi:GDPmannose 4,6-dehydratase
VYLGNIDSKRDWGHAKDYIEMQWLMLQQDIPEDFTISTGIQYSVREFIELAAKKINISIKWKGKGINEVGLIENTNKIIIRIDSRYFRPTEVETLLGDSSKAASKLNWKPKISFEELVEEMITADMKEAKKDKLFKEKGFSTLSHHE